MNSKLLFAVIIAIPFNLATLNPTLAADSEKGKTVAICHKPGTPAQKTLVLPTSAAASHVAEHGDLQGTCDAAVLPPGTGVTLFGAGNTSVTVEANSVPFEAYIGIAPAMPADFAADPGNLVSLGGVKLLLAPTQFNLSVLPPTLPLTLSIPAPAGLPPDTVVLVAQQIFTDSLGDPANNVEPSLKEQFVAVGVASVVDGNIVTQAGVLPGVFSGGLFSFFQLNTGFATGTVSDPTGTRAGITVGNNTNTIVAVTNAAGTYTLPISGSCPCPFSVTGFDPFRGSSGSTGGNVASDGGLATANIALAPLATPAITRDGIRNSGFERGDLSSWALAGSGTTRQSLVSSAATIMPTEGQWMADINTGSGSIGAIGSSIKQRFTVPANVRTLRLDFNFVSEEFPEFVGSQFNDAFTAVITTPQGDILFAQTSVNSANNVTLIGDCNFPGGDNTCGQTGWMEGSVDLSMFSGTGTPIQVDLIFSTLDAGDDIYDTHVLVDNIRFSTVWIDAKILQGPTIAANANLARVNNEVRGVNEILSQAGVNARVRNVQTVATTDALVDTDITWTTGLGCPGGTVNGILTAESAAVLALARSATATDVNVYYIRSGTGLAGVGGYALGPDDFCSAINILVNSGTFQMDIGMGGNILAHELGHLLVSPATAGNILEHSAPAGNFLSTTPAIGVLNRQQSANINRVGAPLPLP